MTNAQTISEKYGKTPAEKMRIKNLLRNLTRYAKKSQQILIELSTFGINNEVRD